MNSPHIAIIVLHYKNPDDTRACLKSLEKIDYPLPTSPKVPPQKCFAVSGDPGRGRSILPPPLAKGRAGVGYSVIVVNNDSPEHVKGLKNEFPALELIQNKENIGFAEGNNVGIRHALRDNRTDAVLILNNDTVVEPNFLSEMVLGIEGGSAMVAPRMMQYDKRSEVDNLGIVFMASGLPFNRRSEKQKLFCPSAGCALYSRKLLERIAYEREGERYYFDRTYFAYCEDVDVGFRARLAGFEAAYAPNAVVYHKGSASTSKLSNMAVYHTYRNLIWTQFKNLPATLFLRQFLWLVIGWKFIFLVYLVKGRPHLIAKAVFDGMRGLGVMKRKRRETQKKRIVRVKAVRSWFERGVFPRNLL